MFNYEVIPDFVLQYASLSLGKKFLIFQRNCVLEPAKCTPFALMCKVCILLVDCITMHGSKTYVSKKYSAFIFKGQEGLFDLWAPADYSIMFY